jgi:hypothetical protein
VDYLLHVIQDGLLFEIVKKLFIIVGAAVGVHVFMRYVLHFLLKWREIVALWVAVVFVVGALLYANAERGYGPRLQGAIIEGSVGPWSDPMRPNSAMMIMVSSITNAGNAQSIATNFRLSIKTKGNSYQGELMAVPEVLEVGSFGPLMEKAPYAGIRFYGRDSLYNKAATPIPPGGMVYGLLIFAYPNIDWHVFDENNLELTLSFSDAFETNYSVTKVTSSRQDYLWHAHPGVQIDLIPKNQPMPSEQKK